MKVAVWRAGGVVLAIALSVCLLADTGASAAKSSAVPVAGGAFALGDVARELAPIEGPAHLATTFDDSGLRKTDKISSILDKLYRVDLLSRAALGRPVTSATASSLTGDLGGLVATRQMYIDDAGRVQVWVDAAGAPANAANDLIALGAYVQRVDDASGIVQALVPVQQLPEAAAASTARDVRLPQYGFVQTGSATTQGDSILGSQTLRSTLTATGAGVRVGVISDGVAGLASAQGSNDLGTVDTTTCNAALQASQSPPPPPPSPTAPGAGAEGTAMLEIVHDIAPDAQLFFGYFGMNVGGTALDFNAAVNCLAAHTDVVVDDISWYNVGPYDGTNLVSANTSAALTNPANPIRGYYTSVSNQAQDHYHGTFVDSQYHAGNLASDWWELDRFQGGGGTTDAGYGLMCSSTVRCGDTIVVPAGASFTVYIQWNDPFGSSTNDYDLLMQDNTTASLYLMSAQRQGPSFPYPVEGFSATNIHGVTTTYNILIGRYKNAGVARTFDMYIFCAACSWFSTGLATPDNYAQHNYNTVAGSVPAQSDAAGGVISVGAISSADSPGYDTIEYYSSRGPTADARIKPEVTGIDCVSVTGAGGFPNPFCGTSAAAPHAAGIAALLLSCNPLLLAGSPTGTPASNRAMLHDALLNSATDVGPPSVDNTYGHGRLDTMSAAPLASCVDSDGDGYPDGLETSTGKDPHSYCATMRADVEYSGTVNILDLSRVVGYYNKPVPVAPPRYDQNRDGKINILDLSMMAAHYNQLVTACP